MSKQVSEKSENGGLEDPFGEHSGDFLASFLQISLKLKKGTLRPARLPGSVASQGELKEAT